MPKNTDNVSTPCGLIETPNDRPSFHSRMVSHVSCIVDTHLVGDRSGSVPDGLCSDAGDEVVVLVDMQNRELGQLGCS